MNNPNMSTQENSILLEEILDRIKTADMIGRYDLLAKEMVKVYDLGRKSMVEDIIDLTPVEMPQMVFPEGLGITEVIEVAQFVNQEGYEDGFMTALEGQMSIYEVLKEE